jgi:hypothetical protein
MGGKGTVFVLLLPPIRCHYNCTNDTALGILHGNFTGEKLTDDNQPELNAVQNEN